MRLTPVQQVVFKLIEGIPLDDTEKFLVRTFEPRPDGFTWMEEEFTEKGYVQKLQGEGRCIIPEGFSDPEWRARNVKQVCLVTGRRAGKVLITSEVASAILGRQVVSHVGPNVASLLTVAADKGQADLILRGMSNAVFRRPDLEARLANETQSYIQFQTDDDIARTGTWKGSQRQARASVRLVARTSQAKGLRGSDLAFLCMDEPDHMLANQADEVFLAGSPSLPALQGTALFIGTPGPKGWMRKQFGQPNVLSLRIPTWQMNPTIPTKLFEDEYKKDPDSAMIDWGACWAEQVQITRPVSTTHADEIYRIVCEVLSRSTFQAHTPFKPHIPTWYNTFTKLLAEAMTFGSADNASFSMQDGVCTVEVDVGTDRDNLQKLGWQDVGSGRAKKVSAF